MKFTRTAGDAAADLELGDRSRRSTEAGLRFEVPVTNTGNAARTASTPLPLLPLLPAAGLLTLLGTAALGRWRGTRFLRRARPALRLVEDTNGLRG